MTGVQTCALPISDSAALQAVDQLEQSGHTAVLLKHGGAVLAALAYADTLRPTAAAAVRQLRQLGVERVIMLTGDNEHVARGIAQQTGVDEYHAGLLPTDKMRLLQLLKRQSVKVAMVGDGVNDAPALAASSLGIAMGGAGTDVALETADVVLMADDLLNLPYVIALGRSCIPVFYWIVMDIVESCVKVSFISDVGVCELEPDTSFARQALFEIPFAGGCSVEMFEGGRHIIE